MNVEKITRKEKDASLGYGECSKSFKEGYYFNCGESRSFYESLAI